MNDASSKFATALTSISGLSKSIFTTCKYSISIAMCSAVLYVVLLVFGSMFLFVAVKNLTISLNDPVMASMIAQNLHDIDILNYVHFLMYESWRMNPNQCFCE